VTSGVVISADMDVLGNARRAPRWHISPASRMAGGVNSPAGTSFPAWRHVRRHGHRPKCRSPGKEPRLFGGNFLIDRGWFSLSPCAACVGAIEIHFAAGGATLYDRLFGRSGDVDDERADRIDAERRCDGGRWRQAPLGNGRDELSQTTVNVKRCRSLDPIYLCNLRLVRRTVSFCRTSRGDVFRNCTRSKTAAAVEVRHLSFVYNRIRVTTGTFHLGHFPGGRPCGSI
jgi:hypothetical protein